MSTVVAVSIALPVFLVVAYILVSLGVREQRQRQAAFEKQFPPISDTEFMSLCPPGTKPTIALKVRRIFADQLGVEYERIYPSSRIVEDLGAE